MMNEMWRIADGPHGGAAPPGTDAEGWRWTIEHGDERRDVRVLVSRTALAIEHQHSDTADAIQTKGRSQVETVLGEEDPPPVIRCTSIGCTWDYTNPE
jgi:hypothetical protein